MGRGSLHNWIKRSGLTAALAGLTLSPATAQVRTVDPNTAIDADLVPGTPASPSATPGTPPAYATDVPPPPPPPPTSAPAAPATAPATTTTATTATVPCTATGAPQSDGTTYKEDDLIGAAEGLFGKGAQGLADIIEKTLKEQGQPVAYIAGREASGAIGVGLRYGSGTMCHKVEGQRPVYWTGPSLGFDLGGNAGKTFVLVYNLYDSQDLYHRYPAGEGAAYFVGGFNASYLRWGKVVLIPIRVGVGVRLGANIGYMKFTEKRRILPF